MKLAVTSLLADQLILPVELGSSVKVTVHAAVTPQLPPSKVVGLTDQDGGGGGGVVGVHVQCTVKLWGWADPDAAKVKVPF